MEGRQSCHEPLTGEGDGLWERRDPKTVEERDTHGKESKGRSEEDEMSGRFTTRRRTEVDPVEERRGM